ncbi:hypothetical protein [Bacillus sp. FJAT-27445]|uniref:hypothetical protein n=1 Tax=Bacillus sp. FJAT-27445 TaxID=1679166 RepID=UPI0007439C13|nr:hypothetical protein [Bacillus sp. FJAT-27445]
MEKQPWLQGGPFLEVSFLMELNKEDKLVVQDIVSKLSELKIKVEIADQDIREIIDSFVTGYPWDENDPNSVYLHTLTLRTIVYLQRQRKSLLEIEKISSNAIMVNFYFYGCNNDLPEWGQIGIRKEEMPDFTNFLVDLYSAYEFKVGGIAVEENVIGLFKCHEVYPNECYRFENLIPDSFLLGRTYFLELIWNEKYKKISSKLLHYRRLAKDGILVKLENNFESF